MSSIEIGLRPPPGSDIHTNQEVTTVRTVRVEKNLIEDIVVNNRARDYLPKNLHWLLSPDAFIPQMTVPIRVNTQNNLLVPIGWGRTIPEWYGEITVANQFIAGLVMGKGTPSGKYYKEPRIDDLT